MPRSISDNDFDCLLEYINHKADSVGLKKNINDLPKMIRLIFNHAVELQDIPGCESFNVSKRREKQDSVNNSLKSQLESQGYTVIKK